MSVDSLKLDLNKPNFQEYVFHRWINNILLKKGIKITNLYDDLANGIYMVYLIELLTFHEFKSKIKNPSFRTQKLENITMVLKYLQENEQIKFLNIDSSNILNKESKLILTFIWHIIEYFSILKPLELYFNLRNNINSGKSVKQKFLLWLKSKIFPLSIRNLSADFKSGIVIGALINYYDNNLCTDWKLWKENNTKENVKIAIETAANKLGIPTLIEPDELINSKIDEKSIMTYLSQFILLEFGIRKENIESMKINGLDRITYQVKEPIYFTIDTKSCLKLKIILINPSGENCFVDCSELLRNIDGLCYSFKFIPLNLGQYHVSIISAESEEILKSIQLRVIDENNVKIFSSKVFQNNNSIEDKYDSEIPETVLLYRGRGLQSSGIRIGDIAEFTITILDINKWNILNFINALIKTPDNQIIEIKSVKHDDFIKFQYIPRLFGSHEIMITIKNYSFKKHFKVNVNHFCTSQISAFGPGLKHATINDSAVFIVETNGENGILNFTIEGPDEAQIECKDNGDGSATVVYRPISIGEYAIHILNDDQDIRNSPFMIDVIKRKTDFIPSKVKVYGPAFNESCLPIGQPAIFTVDVTESKGSLDYLNVECYDRFANKIAVNVINEDSNKRTFSFVPQTTIKLCLLVTYDKILICDSPNMIYVVENSISNKIAVKGSGLESACCGKESLFFVDCHLVPEEGHLEVMVTDSNLNKIPCIVEPNRDELNVYNVRYVPPFNITRCLIEILFNKISIFKEPIIVPIMTDNENLFVEHEIPYENSNRISVNDSTNNFQNHIEKSKPGDVFKGFSDLFLDPNAVSLLKIIVPPKGSPDSSSDNLPLPPVNLSNDNYDCCVDNSPVRFTLSTVFEESEENCSIRDSILSSGTHSRASVKDEIVSLSRRSSFTLAASPNLLGIPNHTKPETTPNLSNNSDSFINDFQILSNLPPKPYQLENEFINFDNPDLYIDDNMPLPEPPPDCELLLLNKNDFLEFSESNTLNIHQEQTESMADIYQELPTSTNQIPSSDLYLQTKSVAFCMKINELIRNHYFIQNPYCNSLDILVNEDNFLQSKQNFDRNSSDSKLDYDNPISDVLPVNLMGAILSPFDEDDSYLSDTSCDSLTFEKVPLNKNYYHKYLTENFSFQHNLQTDIIEDIKSIPLINSRNIIKFEEKKQYHRIIKEITTSEISEITETSQWLSNEERMNNYLNEEHIDDQSFINSFSDIPKSSSSNIIQTVPLINRQETKNFNNYKISHYNTICQNNTQSEVLELNPLTYEKVINLLRDCKCKELEEESGQVKLLFCESDNCTESLTSNSFPDPPTDLLEKVNEINVCNSKSDITNEQFAQNLIKSKTSSSYKERINLINPEINQCLHLLSIGNESLNVNNLNENNLNPNEAHLKYFESNKQLMKISSIKTIAYSEANCVPLDKFKGPQLNHYPNIELKGISSQRNRLSNSLISESKSDVFNEIYPFNENFDIAMKEGSKSSTVSVENILNELSRPIKFSRRKKPVKRRSYSQSHVYNSHSIEIPSFSKQNSLECLNNSFDNYKFKESKISLICQSTLSKDEDKSIDKYNTKKCNKPINLENPIVSSFGDEIANKATISNQHNISKCHLIRDKTVTNVEDHESCIMSDIHPERDENHLRYNDIDSTEIIPEISVHGDGLFKAFLNLPAEILIKTNGHGTDGISLAIEGPSKTEMETTNLSDGNCKVVYTPQLPGEYILSIQQHDHHIKGSPFKIAVRSNENDKTFVTAISTSKKAYAEGQGLSDALIDFPNQFNIFTKDAGPGGLSLSIEGPSKAIIEFKDAKNGVCGVTYKVREPGLYTCIVKFNRKHIRGSPFAINVNPKPIIGSKLNEIPTKFEVFKPMYQIGKKSIFTTNINKVNLDPKIKWIAYFYSPSGNRKEVYVNYDYKNNNLWAEFVPNEIGIHWLSFMYESNKNLSINYDTSFQIVVEEIDNFDITKFHRELESIKVFGKGLVRGKVGVANAFHIEIGESVSGALNVTVDGPSKVEIKCNETESGFRFSYIPAIQGDYLVTIKYGGEYQIKGSPFQVKILSTNKTQNKIAISKKRMLSSPMSHSSNTEISNINNTDISSILCYGSGLSKARIHMWMDFYIDASKAKINHLLIGILGPKEPCEEIRILYIENNRFLVSYKPKEKGNHSVIIKWGDTHLSCSPVVIEVE